MSETPQFQYRVAYANDEGDRSSARFLNARSAFIWAKRLSDEGFEFKIWCINKDGGAVELSYAELKKEAGPIATKKQARIGKQLYTTK